MNPTFAVKEQVVVRDPRENGKIIDDAVVIRFEPRDRNAPARLRLLSQVAHPGKQCDFSWDRDAGWRFLFPDPMTGEPVFSRRFVYVIERVEPGKIHPREAHRQLALAF